MRLDDIVAELDAYFGVGDVRGDDWSDIYAFVYPSPYWRDYVEPGYEGRWNGLVVRGEPDVGRAATCVFPSDRIIESLPPRTLLFSEHPVDFADEPGFLPLAQRSFDRMRRDGISFYHVHAPLDHHREVSPSRLCAQGIGIQELEEYYPIAEGIPGGAAVIGDSDLSLDELAERLRRFLGAEIPVQVLTRPRDEAGRVAIVAGGGAQRDAVEDSFARGCQTFVTGNAATRCRIDFVQAGVREFHVAAAEAGVAVVDATHYGTEKPPQLAMIEWFRRLGVDADFFPDGPK